MVRLVARVIRLVGTDTADMLVHDVLSDDSPAPRKLTSTQAVKRQKL
jgi:hypothetical protein